jgi:hypothetical protein
MIYDVLCNHQIFRLLLKSKIVNQYSIFKLDYKHLTLWTDTNYRALAQYDYYLPIHNNKP